MDFEKIKVDLERELGWVSWSSGRRMRGVSVLERSRSGMLWGKGLGKRGWRMMG